MFVLQLGRAKEIKHLAFAPDGRALAGSGHFGVCLWNALAAGQRPERPILGRFAGRAGFTADGRWLFTTFGAKLARIDLSTHAFVPAPMWGDRVMAFDVAPREPLILVTQFEVGENRSTFLALWRPDDLSPAGKVWEREFDDGSLWNFPQFLPCGDRFLRVEAAWAKDPIIVHRVAVYDTMTGALISTSDPLHHGGVVSPDGRWLIYRSTSIIEASPLDPVGGRATRLKAGIRKHFTDIAFHPSGKYFAATSNDATVKLYDTTSWREARTFAWDIGKMCSICFSADGTLAAAGSNKGQVVVWDVDL